MKGPKTIFVCRECGTTTIRPLGRCPDCGSFNSFDEERAYEEPKKSVARESARAEKISELTLPQYLRAATGMAELDRVLGGGLVSGSVVLI